MNSFKNMLNDDQGATLVEYGLIIGLVAAICIGAVTTLGSHVQSKFTTLTGQM